MNPAPIGPVEVEELNDAPQPIHTEAEAKELLDSVASKTQDLRTRERAEEFEFQQRRAKMYAASGLFRDKKADPITAMAQTMVRIDLGESLGFTPAQSLQGIHVINGATAISSALRADRLARFGYSWDIEWLNNAKGECEGCRLWVKLHGKPMLDRNGNQITEAYTKADAQRMMTTIWDNKIPKRVSILEKDNWQMSPRNMYFARAITNFQRFYAPHVLSAMLPSVEEAEDFDMGDNASPMQTATQAKAEALAARLAAAKVTPEDVA